VRIVLDTNVVVSALIWGGTPGKLIEAAARGDIELFTSPALLAELRGVLNRDALARRLEQNGDAVADAIALYTELSVSVSPAAVPRLVPRDADDDQVIAAALADGAEFVVSGDRDLLTLGSRGNIRMLTPAEAVRLLEP
jgi:hypothetical protein